PGSSILGRSWDASSAGAPDGDDPVLLEGDPDPLVEQREPDRRRGVEAGGVEPVGAPVLQLDPPPAAVLVVLDDLSGDRPELVHQGPILSTTTSRSRHF